MLDKRDVLYSLKDSFAHLQLDLIARVLLPGEKLRGKMWPQMQVPQAGLGFRHPQWQHADERSAPEINLKTKHLPASPKRGSSDNCNKSIVNLLSLGRQELTRAPKQHLQLHISLA